MSSPTPPDIPEDCLAKLAIELFEEDILTREGTE